LSNNIACRQPGACNFEFVIDYANLNFICLAPIYIVTLFLLKMTGIYKYYARNHYSIELMDTGDRHV